jgi:hypothetical protein
MAQRYIKGTFTSVPNKHALRGQPASVQAVYFWICDYANDNGICYPSLKRLQADTSQSRSTILRSIQALVNLKILKKKAQFTEAGDKDVNLYQIMIVDVVKGGVMSEPPSVMSELGVVSQLDQGGVTDGHRTKPIRTKPINNSTNVELAKPGNSEINECFSYWNEQLGYALQSKVRANRYACSNLLKRHGLAGVRRLVDGVKVAQADQYAPRIADYCDLQSKFNQLISWCQKQRKGQVYKI